MTDPWDLFVYLPTGGFWYILMPWIYIHGTFLYTYLLLIDSIKINHKCNQIYNRPMDPMGDVFPDSQKENKGSRRCLENNLG